MYNLYTSSQALFGFTDMGLEMQIFTGFDLGHPVLQNVTLQNQMSL